MVSHAAVLVAGPCLGSPYCKRERPSVSTQERRLQHNSHWGYPLRPQISPSLRAVAITTLTETTSISRMSLPISKATIERTMARASGCSAHALAEFSLAVTLLFPPLELRVTRCRISFEILAMQM